MIEANGLVKRYGSTVAVNDLSFSVRPGVVTGFLGPNGAGKTTTMRMILGLDAPTQGSVTIGGRSYRDLPAPMHEVGALLDAKALHGGRRARDHLLCLAQSNGIPRSRVDEVLRTVGLEGVARHRAKGKGALIADTSVDEFVRSSSQQSVHVRSPQAAELAALCRQAGATVQAGTDPDVIEITGMDSAEVGRLAAAHGIALSELIPVRASLEEAFMELTRESVEYQAAGATR
jgi:energy-coupling factor transporter ATP-binding protein EcfA2